MNKDLIFVTAHCPTDEQVNRLRLCIDSLIIEGFDLALISHTHIPLDIQQKCNYYIYDYLNELIDDDDIKHSEVHFGEKHVIKTKMFKKQPFYGLAIYRMFSTISKLAENFSYEKIYHVEYDYVIKTPQIFFNHKEILNTYDSVFYAIEQDDNMILGGLKSFRVSSLPDLFKNYNKDLMLQRIKSESLKPLEHFTTQIFLESGTPFFINSKLLKDKVTIKKFVAQELNWTLCYHSKIDNLGFYYVNFYKEELLKVIVNHSKTFDLEIKDKKNAYVDLGEIETVNHVTVLRNETIIYSEDISPELKDKIKKDSLVREL